MKLDKEILEEKIREYRTFKSCSESTLMGLCEIAGADISQKKMVKLACGFAGGMGGTFDEGTCGAVIQRLNPMLKKSLIHLRKNMVLSDAIK